MNSDAKRNVCEVTWHLVFVVLLIIGWSPIAFAQDTSPESANPAQIIQFLNRTIDWYRHLAAEQQIATELGDLIVVNDNRPIADQVVRLAFDFARGAAQARAKRSNVTPDEGGISSQYQSLIQLQAKIEKQRQDTQEELDGLRQKVQTATGKKRQDLQSQLAELQGELDLDTARTESMNSMVEFVTGTSTNGVGGTGLRAQVEALASSLPATLTAPSNTREALATSKEQSNPALISEATKPESSGIWDLSADLLALSSKLRSIDTEIHQTNDLGKTSREISAPLVTRLRELSNRGDELAKEADTANPAALARQKHQLDALTSQFKQTSAAVIPLSKQGILLGLYQTNLTNWSNAVRSRRTTELKGLLARVAVLAVLLGIVVGAAELWRRAVLRYVHEPRRRYQYLLLRRFVMWFLIVVIIASAFASRLGSVVTFAGLLTAGVAVALQSVIISFVGYFFLIGKYGIRVGDRVQIGGVIGEVIDVGLVRLHLMELGGGRADTPTGRVVAFSNSVVFQPLAGLFKQIPGTNFVWHEFALVLAPETDSASVKTRLVEAVEAVLADYKDEMEQQQRVMQTTLISASPDGFRPKAELRFTSSSLEAAIRYPVDLQHAGEIDERITSELLKALDREPKLKLANSGSPSIRLRTDLASVAT